MSIPKHTTKAESGILQAIISLGSNLHSRYGSPVQSLRQAMDRIRQLGSGKCLVSCLYSTTPVDCPLGTPDFVNAVVVLEVEAGTEPACLLKQLHGIEHDYGRLRHGAANGSRTLDLDLIAVGGLTSLQPSLILPHPRAHLRRFVLEPLAELCPELILPTQSVTVRELLSSLPDSPWCRKIPADLL